MPRLERFCTHRPVNPKTHPPQIFVNRTVPLLAKISDKAWASQARTTKDSAHSASVYQAPSRVVLVAQRGSCKEIILPHTTRVGEGCSMPGCAQDRTSTVTGAHLLPRDLQGAAKGPSE